MRKTITTLFAFALVALASAPAYPGTVVLDDFLYPDGPLVPNGGWTNFGSGTGIQIVSESAVGFGPNLQDAQRKFASQGNTSITYACFSHVVIHTPQVAGAPKPMYFAALTDGGGNSQPNRVARLYVLPIAGGWTFGISAEATDLNTRGVTPWSATTLQYEQGYRVVINYNPVAQSATLWVNPDNALSPSVTSVDPLLGRVPVSALMLLQSNVAAVLPSVPPYAGTADWGYSVQSIGVGAAFSEACTGPTPARSSSWGWVKSIYR